MTQFGQGTRLRNSLHSLVLATIVTLVTLATLEIALRVLDLRELREGVSERSLSYQYDAELGWAPIPGSSASVTNARVIQAHHDSLGLRDEELARDGQPIIMFLGDSFVWGLDAEEGERFSDLLKARLSGFRVLAAGVSGYGTDQEYLLLRRLWPKVRPAAVVLIFCTDNDRADNSTNIRYEGYHKPYFVTAPDGSLELQGEPVPRSRLQSMKEDWWVRNVWLARLANAVYLKLRHPVLYVPDPTEVLVDKIREFVETNGARFLAGLQTTDSKLVRHLEANNIPFVTFDGAPSYPGASVGNHWTPDGHKVVADRLIELLSRSGVVQGNTPR
jgi:hypothetical protein